MNGEYLWQKSRKFFTSVAGIGPIRLFSSAVLALIGLDIKTNGFTYANSTLFLMYLLFFGFFEMAFFKAAKEIEDEAKAAAREEATELMIKKDEAHKAELNEMSERCKSVIANLEIRNMTLRFLATRQQKTNLGLSNLYASLSSGDLQPLSDTMKKKQIFSETLQVLCDTLYRYSLAKNGHVLPEDVIFRSTYMEVQKKKLVYVAWHTHDGHPPRSYSEGKTFEQGQGIAGMAWDKKRPQIEDQFDHSKGWVENYPGQCKKYKSMACVPVFMGNVDDQESVIGVITVDTSKAGFFGTKDDRDSEDWAGEVIKPFADYIAFISQLHALNIVLQKQLALLSSEKNFKLSLQEPRATV